MARIIVGCAVVGRGDNDCVVQSHLGKRHVAGIEVAVDRYYKALLFELQFEGVLARMREER